jgi:hypothetical protein
MLALSHQRVGQRRVTVQKDVLVCPKLENKVNDFEWYVDVEMANAKFSKSPSLY